MIETILMCCKEIDLPEDLENILIKFIGNSFKIAIASSHDVDSVEVSDSDDSS